MLSIIVWLNLQMPEVVHFVLCMNQNMGQNAGLLDVPIQKLLEFRHASNTVQIGPDFKQVHLTRSYQNFGEWFEDKVKHYHGSRPQLQILNDMMRICQKYNGRTISLLTDFIASKLSVFPVGS